MSIDALQSKVVAMTCFLWNAETNVAESSTPDNKPRLTGTTITNHWLAQDEFNEPGVFFLFNDLSVRTPGRYRLHFQFMIVPMDKLQGHVMPYLAETTSNVFQVSQPIGPNKFPGMSESTPLLKALKEAGCAIKLRRGSTLNSRSKNARSTPESESAGGDLQESQAKNRRRKRGGKK